MIQKRGRIQIKNAFPAPMSGTKRLLRKRLQISGLLRSWLPDVRRLFFLVICVAGSSFSASSQNTLKIGFLIRDKANLAIRQAAELAIKKANDDGGYQGQKFQLVTRSCDGPWGITSKQAVDLIHEEGVSILVTALDGRNAHLAEQVAAKSHIVMLSTLSSDPTLSRAYVPWYYRIIPDDRQQAEVLVNDIYKIKKHQKVALVALDSYDAKMSVQAFLDEVQKQKLPLPRVINATTKTDLVDALKREQFESMVLAGTTAFPLRQADLPVELAAYAFLNCYNFVTASHLPAHVKTMHALISMGNRDEAQEMGFTSPIQAYIHDGIMLAVEAIHTFGPDPEKIRRGFGNLKFTGVTGNVEFNDLGNRRLD